MRRIPIAVGQNEKITVYGDLTLDTNGGTITTGDISTFGNMTLDASAVRFLTARSHHVQQHRR